MRSLSNPYVVNPGSKITAQTVRRGLLPGQGIEREAAEDEEVGDPDRLLRGDHGAMSSSVGKYVR